MIRESFVTEIYLKQRLHAVCLIIWQIVDLKNFITTKMTKIIFFPSCFIKNRAQSRKLMQ